MPIFKYIILVMTLLLAQQKKVIIPSIKPDIINSSIDSLMKSQISLSREYHLESFNIDSNQSIYKIIDNQKIADSLILFTDSNINKHIQNRILKPYRNIPVGEQYFDIGKKLVSRYYFMNNIPKYDFGLFDNKYLASLITINPNFNNYFSGIFGVSQKNDILKFVGQLDLDFENFIGEAEQIKIFWQRNEILSQKIVLDTFFPHPFRFFFGLHWILDHEIYKGFYISKENSLLLNTYLPLLNNFQIGYNKGEVLATELGKENGYKSLVFNAFTIVSLFDNRNQRLQPTTGKLFKIKFDGGWDNNSTFINSEIYYISFFHIINNSYLKLQYLSKGISYFKELVPKSRYILLGGSSTLRGFQEQEFSLTQYQVFTLEYLIQQKLPMQLKVFIDMGSKYFNPFEKTMVGYGFGINQINDNSIISMDYAIGNSIKSIGKIHIKWLTRF
ncbi:MAG: hypothetical protein CMG55_10215 [Candidatus Marinimicrobia bacterium]|nr:hypothetical protein [Candidatus Neomarinimicrobiota bacterium]